MDEPLHPQFAPTPTEQAPASRSGAAGFLPSLDETLVSPWDGAAALAAGIYGFDSRNIRSRPFNLLRTRLLRTADAQGWRSIGVVSATPGVGKSFVASNLAASLSRTPQRQVYLFDFDLRRSTVAANFGLTLEVGLNDYLAGKAQSLRSIARRPDGESLIVIASLADKSPSAELLGSRRVDEILTAVKEAPQGTIAICDLPPAFANDDAAIMAGKLDAYLLVIEDGRTTKKQIRETLAMLSPAPCAGTILNRYYGGLVADDYGYGYGQSGKYHDYYGS
jgi:protein-tyrosine kinase